MQDSARQDTQCFLFYHSVVGRYPISFVMRLCPVHDLIMMFYTTGLDFQVVKEKGTA